MTRFLDRADDVASFAKNQGPQCLRVDSLTSDGRRTLYTPDFLIRLKNGRCLLAETKGRRDSDVAGKARAATEWCKAASINKVKWEYLYVAEEIFKQFAGTSIAELVRTCRPTLKRLLEEVGSDQLALPLGHVGGGEAIAAVHEFISEDDLGALPVRARKGIEEAVLLFNYMAEKTKISFSPVFQPLLGPLDAAAETILLDRLERTLPEGEEQDVFFSPDLTSQKKKHREYLENQASLLRRFLVHRSPIMPIGLLRFCLDYASKDAAAPAGILTAVRDQFGDLAETDLSDAIGWVYDFRNTYVAHSKDELDDRAKAEEALHRWVRAIQRLSISSSPVPA